MIFDFDSYDLQFVNVHAARRQVVKESHKVPSLKFDINRTEYELHYIGSMGEYAVARTLGIKIDKDVHPAGDNGSDLYLNGKSLQVKTRTFGGPDVKLFFNDVSDFTADIVVGVQMLSPVRVDILGWISRDEFCEKQTNHDFGYGPRAVVAASALHPISKLREATKANAIGS